MANTVVKQRWTLFDSQPLTLPDRVSNNFLKFPWDGEVPMDIKTKYGWQELYATALLETDWSKMEEKIRVAEDGIRGRLHEFSVNHGGTPEENQAIVDALHGPDVLRNDVAGWQKKRAR